MWYVKLPYSLSEDPSSSWKIPALVYKLEQEDNDVSAPRRLSLADAFVGRDW